MNPDRQQAIQYLRAPSQGPWRWTEDGAVVVWRDGSTIAFREEIVEILRWLAPNGLPPFGAIVFLLAAARGKILQVGDLVVESKSALPAGMGYDAKVLVSARKQLRMQLEIALAQLTKVAQLPREVNTGIKARCVLTEAVFESAKSGRQIAAQVILQGMREPMSDEDLKDEALADARGTYLRQIHLVAEGLKPHSAETLELRIRTGLDALPEESDTSLPTADRARRLIEELSRDKEFGAVARAARELMAAVRLPRRLGEREELAIGGVSDITNRGPLDRLLLSELAHDDLTLSVRVALNEALYLRREPPVREPPGTLAVLLDSGVRLWGVPRVLATAVALALIARDKQHHELLAWRARGRKLEPVDLLTRNGLSDHLAALETNTHPGGALPAFNEAVAPGAENQTVLITHRDTLEDPDFRQLLATQAAAPGFVATVDRAGHFELHALPLARRPPICKAELDLESVFDPKSGVSPLRSDRDPNLPAIFGVQPFPFLLPLTGKVNCWTKANNGFTYAVLNDRRLVQFRDNQAGARVLSNDLPGGAATWMECVNETLHIVKASASQRPARLLSFPLPYGPLRTLDLATGEELRAVHRYGEVILLIRESDVRAHALGDGRLLGRALIAHTWIHGRFFRGQSHIYFATWDGQDVKFEPVTLPNSFTPSVVAMVFDRQGVEGPWVVQGGGVIVSGDGESKTKFQLPSGHAFGLKEIHVSSDGHRIYASIGSKWGQIIDLQTGRVRAVDPPSKRNAELDPSPLLPVWNIFRIIEQIAPLSDGIALCGRKAQWRKLGLEDYGKLRIGKLPTDRMKDVEAQEPVPFAGHPGTRRGATLQLAQWPSGSKAFLDSHGLLHLKSHDPNLPEISLVLSDGEVAGWTSDGHTCGHSFFFEGTHASEPEKVIEAILKFLHHL